MTWQPPHHEKGSSLRTTLDEDGWRVAIVEILDRYALPSTDASLFASGSDIVFGTADHVVKMSHPRWSDEIATERVGLERAARGLDVRTPQPVAHGALADWPYIVMSRIPGKPLARVWPDLDGSARRAMGRELGKFLRSLHDIPVDEDPELTGFIDRMRGQAKENHLGQGISPAWADRIEPFLEEVWPVPSMPSVFLHTEVMDEHVFAERSSDGWHVSGIIDFADCCIGHPGYEFPALAEFIFRGDGASFRECLLAYGFAPGDLGIDRSREFLAWSLVHQFGSLPRMLRAVGAPEPRSLEDLALRLYPLEG